MHISFELYISLFNWYFIIIIGLFYLIIRDWIFTLSFIKIVPFSFFDKYILLLSIYIFLIFNVWFL